MIHNSLIYRNKFGNAAMRAVWSEDSLVQGWLDFEAAVAWAQGEVGIIPRRTAAAIVRHCNIKTITPKAIAAHHERTGHVIVSLIKSLQRPLQLWVRLELLRKCLIFIVGYKNMM